MMAEYGEYKHVHKPRIRVRVRAQHARKPKGEMTPTPASLRKLSPGTSLNDIERGTGISVSHLSRVFNGGRNFSSDNLRAVAGYLGVSVDELLAALAKAQAA